MKQNFSELMKQAQQMQSKMQDAQKELESMVVTGVAGAGMVEIEMTGRHDVKKVTIDDELLDDKSMLEDLVAAGVNDAVRKVEAKTREKMSGLTAGLDLPTNLGDSDS